MKHPVAVSFLVGISDALAEEVQSGNMAQRTAKQVISFGMAVAMERLKGASVLGKKLEEFQEDGERIESLLRAEKVNLQKYGDT